MLVHHTKTLESGARIRILVIDDSAVMRSLVSQALNDDPALEVVGTAANGTLGLAKVAQLNPDVITLDIEMPNMSGLEMLGKLRVDDPHTVVIMLSTLTSRGASATLDALMRGANDYVAKPSHCGSVGESILALQEELIPKIKQFFRRDKAAPAAHRQTSAKAARPTSPSLPCRREVVAIGVSTGGPNALSTIAQMLPEDFPCPVLIVQHMPPLFTRLLAERLQSLTRLRVEEATQGCAVAPGKILIAPGDFHMVVQRSGPNTVVGLQQSERRNSCRPSVDVLFESVSELYGRAAIAAVLTGMGQDGLRGAEALKANGAYVIAQDEASSVVWSMPGALVRAGLADAVAPLDSIAPEIVKQYQSSLCFSCSAGRP